MLSLEPPYVFVYGTLKRGGSNAILMQEMGADFVGLAYSVQPYPLRIGEYPFLEDNPGEGYCVEGEIYQIPTMEGWELLDRLEDHPRLYERRVREFRCNDKTLQAWTYFLNTNIPGIENIPIIRNFDVTKIRYM